jgi:hypothetical protein
MRNRTKFGDPLVDNKAVFTPDPVAFLRIYHDLRTFGAASDGAAYLNISPLGDGNFIHYAPPDPVTLAWLVLASYRGGVPFDPRDMFALDTLPQTPPRW